MLPLKIPRPKRGRPFLPEEKRKVHVTVRVPHPLFVWMTQYSETKGIPVTDAIVEALELFRDEKIMNGEVKS